jgi:hypothetical protein
MGLFVGVERAAIIACLPHRSWYETAVSMSYFAATRSTSGGDRAVRRGISVLDFLMLERRFLARLRRVDGVGRDLLAAMLFFLLHFFVVRDIAWVSHGSTMRGLPALRGRTARRALV